MFFHVSWTRGNDARRLRVPRLGRLIPFACWIVVSVTSNLAAQNALTWKQVKDRFESANPTLRAGILSIDESRAEEITAFLRPNPDFTVTGDQLDPFTFRPFRPFYNALPLGSFSYLHERQHKRELRLQSAEEATAITVSQQEDLERTLLFSLRSAFVTVLQAKAVLQNAKDNLEYYDRELQINRDRLKLGDISEVDEDRLELQRVQFESDLVNAQVSLRTSKIQILTLLNDRTPVDRFDVNGLFDFSDLIPGIDEVRNAALDARPDLRAAIQSARKAHTDHTLAVANGSTDPTFSVDAGRNPPLDHYIGISISIPLRIFDRNQGEKIRTEIDITRTQRLLDATKAQVFSDVDSAYATMESTLLLLKPYKSNYLPRAVKVRDTVSYAYQRGAATLLDFLDAQKSYRDVRLNYLNLIASYLTAAAQLNMAAGLEEIQ